MADTNPAPAVAVEETTIDNVVASTEAVSIDAAEEHVHGPDCNHDHSHEQQQVQAQRNDFDLLELNGTKDKTTDPLVKVRLGASQGSVFTDGGTFIRIHPHQIINLI